MDLDDVGAAERGYGEVSPDASPDGTSSSSDNNEEREKNGISQDVERER